MKMKLRQMMSFLLCLVMLLGAFPGINQYEHLHLDSDHIHTEHEEHEEHIDVITICEDAIGFMLSLFAVPVHAAYEDGVECEFCGSWRYDDWKCDNGDHCGDGADGDCYSEHHCGDCGECVEDDGLCSECEFCMECCICEDRCRGCQEYGETVCKDCGEKCSGCSWICGECEKCTDCIGDELFCSYCDICIECAEWICYCGDGCSECALGCEDCGEKCTKCASDELCLTCMTCFECIGGEGNYCEECQLCKNCVNVVCACGAGCSECAYVCPECGEYCENCSDGYICMECGICDDCAGGDNNFCHECLICKDHVDYICICGGGCSNCAVMCKQCGEKCENCADDMLCTDCETCFDCVGGDGNYCAECGLCKNCVEQVCSCGNGCSNCAQICPECTDKCENCADEEICGGCNICKDCAGGDGNFCDNCQTCKMCSEFVCICGGGCSECVERICPECNEKCSECADDELCTDCGICRDCAGEENFCADCGVCYNCVDMVCVCGGGCSNCTVICDECGEKCLNCSEGDLCTECGKCVDCAGSDSFCITCGLCSDCGVVCPCGEGCENCADLCPECNEKCSNCYDEFCASCDICRDCADDIFCEDCYQCGDCTEVCEECGTICAESVCPDCGKCSGCMDEFCPDCGICIDCADSMCRDCYYCGDCADNICVDCGEYCSDCADACDECGRCENCVDICPDCEMCMDCCAEAAADMGCDHAICPESAEWENHYCTEGGHCAGTSSQIEHDEDEHWTVCGSGCEIRLNSELHTFGEGKVTKEATKKADGVMKFTCTVCGFAKEEVIPKLKDGHTHEYTAVVTQPTCESGGYTTHTCECGHTYTDGQTSAVKHDYQPKHTDTEHWTECTFCNEATDKTAHKLGEWKTTVKAGYTFAGEKQRACKICGYTVCESIPILTVPENKCVVIIPNYADDENVAVDTPDSGTDQPPKETDSAKEPSSNAPAVPDTSAGQSPSDNGASSPVVRELLTKGSDNTVPALPTLPPNEDGNIFEGWVDKSTGEPVKKGDKLTENVELEPVWKDCGEDKHTDTDEDNHCDACGYIIMKEVKPEETTASADDTSFDTGHENEKTPKDNAGAPSWMIIVISCFGSVISICGVVLAVFLKKKK